ncbi:MAG: DNA polymerase III subunit psi [Xanthomonadales bacterium]|nr:DNA polymerase III subunit psi [Xanthomonadales bacterium]
MSQARRRAYLAAMDIPVWVLRGSEPVSESPPSGVRVGPGNGSVLLLCADPEEASLPIAADIARALAGEPVWAWPEEGDEGEPLEAAVAERMLTHVVIMGSELETRLLGGPVSGVIGSAGVLRAPGMRELISSPSQRKSLWDQLCRHGLAGVRCRDNG